MMDSFTMMSSNSLTDDGGTESAYCVSKASRHNVLHVMTIIILH